MFKYLAGLVINTIRSCLKTAPHNRFGDRLISLWSFIITHKRLPNKNLSFLDVLYRLKTSDEILDPLRVFVTDKELAKLFIAASIGPQYPVPTIAILSSPDEIDAYTFPANCCIKPTHSSGQFILRKDGEAIDKECIKSWLGINYYTISREANYRYLTPKIIVEPLLFNSKSVVDYKIFCYMGKPRAIQVDVDRHSDWILGVFDTDWTEHRVTTESEMGNSAIERPANLEQMMQAAEVLCQQFPTIRVDMYSDGEAFYIGELTNCPGSGLIVIPEKDREEAFSELIYGEVP